MGSPSTYPIIQRSKPCVSLLIITSSAMSTVNTEQIKLLINYLIFQIGWFVCVLGGNQPAIVFTIFALCVHLFWIGNWKMEKQLLVICLLLGSTIDSFLGNLQILQFSGDGRLLPGWLACLWVLFGTTLRHSLDWSRKRKSLGALLGLIGGPASYYAGSKLTSVSLGDPLWQTLLILAVIWALVLPLLQSFSEVWLKKARLQGIG